MSKETLFYIFGIALAVSAVVLAFAGLKLKSFPGRAFPLVVLWFVFLVAGSSTYSVLHAKHEQEAHAHELEEAGERIEEGSSGPYENEAGALGGEREELEEEAEMEAPGSVEEEPVGPTEGSQAGKSAQQGQGAAGSEDDGGSEDEPSQGGPEASATTLQLAADPDAIAFDKEELMAKAGEVTIDFHNPSAIPHNVVIEKDGEDLAGTPEITEAKESVSAELEAGEYTFVCTVPGHEEAGMVGTLSVE
jgi:plastocyanin